METRMARLQPTLKGSHPLVAIQPLKDSFQTPNTSEGEKGTYESNAEKGPPKQGIAKECGLAPSEKNQRKDEW